MGVAKGDMCPPPPPSLEINHVQELKTNMFLYFMPPLFCCFGSAPDSDTHSFNSVLFGFLIALRVVNRNVQLWAWLLSYPVIQNFPDLHFGDKDDGKHASLWLWFSAFPMPEKCNYNKHHYNEQVGYDKHNCWFLLALQ